MSFGRLQTLSVALTASALFATSTALAWEPLEDPKELAPRAVTARFGRLRSLGSSLRGPGCGGRRSRNFSGPALSLMTAATPGSPCQCGAPRRSHGQH